MKFVQIIKHKEKRIFSLTWPAEIMSEGLEKPDREMMIVLDSIESAKKSKG